MKYIILLTFTIFAALQGTAQTTTYTNLCATTNQPASLFVQTNQLARVIYFNDNGGCGGISMTVGSATFGYVRGVNFGAPNVSGGSTTPPAPVVAGPATISLAACGYGIPVFCTVELVTPCSSSATFTPSTAVVIPADSGGPVNIILESSVDLINWTAALPGTYGTSTTNRFFRVRAVRAP